MRDRLLVASLVAVSLLTVVVRIAAALVLDQTLASDPLAYFTMARGLAEQGVLADNFGQHAFYSAGYPLVLAPFFKLFGSSVPVALAVNLLLSVAGVWLVAALGRALSQRNDTPVWAALALALWLPGIWNATLLAKENLSTPLLLGLALCAVQLARSPRPAAPALLAGLLWSASLITGGSALLLCAGVAVAMILLWRASGGVSAPLRAGACFAVGAVLALSPWLYATNQMVGRPVLSTNAAFNLYLGHNPAATGRFISIADTPLGADWEQTRLRLGEVANADRLQRAAIGWAAAHPADAARLAVRKLAYFWQPSVPDASDFAVSRPVATIRLFETVQYAAIVALAAIALFGQGVGRGPAWILGAMLLGYWVIHAAAYVIPRYRDPVMPLLIVLATCQVVAWARRGAQSELAHAG
ncbi:hypothetical protein LJR219_001447 [Phenylobacterium sp. LjRoot219]|uniref:hypothetical protein n=1 Tax=Phenylobacterium sp. LjRoot219 TaxID=3342283 RepID=UPI003ED00E9D